MVLKISCLDLVGVEPFSVLLVFTSHSKACGTQELVFQAFCFGFCFIKAGPDKGLFKLDLPQFWGQGYIPFCKTVEEGLAGPPGESPRK